MSGLPAAARKVGNQSRPEKMPFCTESAGTWPGQRRSAGTRKPPSITVPLHCANGVVPPSGQVKSSVPLSVVNTTMVLSSTPRSLSFCMTKPMSSSSWAMPASSSDQPFSELRIFSYLSERWLTMCMRFGLSQHKNCLPSVVAFSMNFHGIQVIQIAKERVEAVDGGQELIQIAEMVFTELAGFIALRLERGGNRAGFCRQTGLGPRLTDRGHPRANRKFTGDEVRPTRRATSLGVIVGEQHSFFGDLVEVRCPAGHHAAMVGADIPHADVIAHDEDYLWFVAVCRLRCRCDERNKHSDGPLSKYVWFWFHCFLFFSLQGRTALPRQWEVGENKSL